VRLMCVGADFRCHGTLAQAKKLRRSRWTRPTM
jgi:hypothetical protein